MTNKERLQKYLSVLKKKRKDLISDFLNEEENVYIPMYRYRKSKALTEISIEKYFLMWISSHYNEFLKRNNKNGDSNTNKEFNIIYLSLVEEFQDSNKTSKLMKSLLNTKIEALKEMIKSGEKSDKNFNRIIYAMEKENVLFENQISKFKNEYK